MKSKKYERRISIICFILFILLVIIVAFSKKVNASEYKSYKNYTVKKGEVIEDIAKRYYSDMNLNKAKYEIKELNNMKNSDIYEGQIIKIKN